MKPFLKGMRAGMHQFGLGINTIINVLLLSFVYFVAVGLTSIVARVAQKEFLVLKTEKTESYWEDLNLTKKERDEYFRQF